MPGVRCDALDDVRCQLEHLLGEPCEVCGGETVVERRRPGTGARKVFFERRDLEEHVREHV